LSLVGVVDVETTGLNPFRNDRIIEIALVVIRPDGSVLREFETLINPQRDVGPTSIHGITARDVVDAPSFAEAVSPLLESLEGCVALAGHNLSFDVSFLRAEFNRLNYNFPEPPQLCTRRLCGGGSLRRACQDFDIAFPAPGHSARSDAAATARLLSRILDDDPLLRHQLATWRPIVWPRPPRSSAVRVVTRGTVRSTNPTSSYVQQLLDRAPPESVPIDEKATLGYVSLLDKFLVDRYVSKEEAQALVDFATRWGISSRQIQEIHRDYTCRLATVALADGRITPAERRDLEMVASLLGTSDTLDELLSQGASGVSQAQPRLFTAHMDVDSCPFLGKSICFTGESHCRLYGKLISRELATDIARSRGILVTQSVTKSLDFLIASDPLTQSGKARRARQYGIPIVDEFVFWRTLGVEVE
jgi:DNA polymerase-3 subunit epsilon